LDFVLVILTAYLLGSIPFGFLVSRLYGVKDIRLVGSGNIGMTNVWRTVGPSAALLVFIGDVGKGMLAVFLTPVLSDASLNLEYLKIIAGLTAVLGHIFSVFLKLRGGKGVNTALGVMIMLLPLEILISAAVFVITVAVSRYISLGSIISSLTLFLVVLLEFLLWHGKVDSIYILLTFILWVMILLTHRSNIRRLLRGDENRFSFRRKVPGGQLNG